MLLCRVHTGHSGEFLSISGYFPKPYDLLALLNPVANSTSSWHYLGDFGLMSSVDTMALLFSYALRNETDQN